MKIIPGRRVALRYEMFDDEGQLVESDPAVEYIHGDGEILPGLEAGLEGREEGETFEITLGPEDAFGPYDPEGVITVLRSQFPEESEFEAGMSVTIGVEMEDGEEEELEMQVTEVGPEEVVLDGNHPLAGRSLRLRVTVTSVSA